MRFVCRQITARLSTPEEQSSCSSLVGNTSSLPAPQAAVRLTRCDLHRKCPESDSRGRQDCWHIGTGFRGGFLTDRPESPAQYPQH
ncbi:hypothetical protein PFLUV_G00017970 [Perca fluviatilis]|uniref:Uncharacterized protein n=1 Tax=Perca fluviatilis TaxID=8168 RepID=A0A6A5FP71_PERFL|nr:hypothetical protein PFLUV_G00017970 [Perca fluviatilis]